MSLYAFHLGQIISIALGQLDHGGQHGNAAQTRIRDETFETYHIHIDCLKIKQRKNMRMDVQGV